jgi:hypothetical protein
MPTPAPFCACAAPAGVARGARADTAPPHAPQLFQRLHQEYVRLTYNPFHPMDTLRITSSRFGTNVAAIVQTFTGT